ncbi:MAG: GTP cyclohydrolase II [Actinomycetaceae bacterium]|nr:GTP cyclohydrolase II [Actinomycetaceae bacterium]
MNRQTATFEQLLLQAYADLAAGRPVLVADDHDRENEVDAIAAAATITEKTSAWMVRHTSGYICAPMTDQRAEALELPLMVPESASEDPKRTAYTITCDAAQGVTTGISAADRMRTLHVLADPHATPSDLCRPGHVVPLRAKAGGVIERGGHTEGTVDLCRLAGLEPVGVLAELVNDDGTMMRYDEAATLAKKNNLVLLTIADLAAWRSKHDLPTVSSQSQMEQPANFALWKQKKATPRITRVETAMMPTEFGDFQVLCYHDDSQGVDHIALVSKGKEHIDNVPLVRIHSECLTGEAFGSLRCDCGPQLHEAMRMIAQEGGAIVYLRGHEGRGIGLAEKIRAYQLQDKGMDTAQANVHLGWPIDRREYGAASEILADLGLTKIRLLTNNPQKTHLDSSLVSVVERLALEVGITPHNMKYLQTKQQLGHTFTQLDTAMKG